MWIGIAFCAAITITGMALSNQPTLQEWQVSPLIVALLLGFVIGNLRPGRQHALFERGLKFCTHWMLRSGIILFGFSVTVQQVSSLGVGAFGVDILIVTAILTIGYTLGTRWLRLDPETALLTSAGSAICGAAAILATESTIRAKPAATAIAVTTVVLFGSLAMFVYPIIFSLFGWDEKLFGVYIGATVHEVAQVVATGEAIGRDALTTAVVVKLMRVMLLVPFLLIVGHWWIRRQRINDGHKEKPTLIVPWFAFGFVGVILLNSFIYLPNSVREGLRFLGSFALTMAMAALGYETRLAKLRSLGFKPFILALILFATLIFGGAIVTPLMADNLSTSLHLTSSSK
ncbi:YeiH family putative sulfate export transporter [Marinobacter nanhaiticus D15-8W]|uniref:YeiH family putative sulfate export transporter n=1 Tax=Marinobacter nanhaiticus D15-8W TaxID=626887 RepID=N6X7W7_9GAMM|nr:YeiH family protein [Marinobacter nanhaiticus]ENO17238.1 YeiH family putative sulfate export transporter [Marinobacter nanhaiticus D15-8W]